MGHAVVNRSSVQKLYDLAETRLERCAVFLVGQLRQNLSTVAQFSEARIKAYSTRSRKIRSAKRRNAKTPTFMGLVRKQQMARAVNARRVQRASNAAAKRVKRASAAWAKLSTRQARELLE